MKCLNPACLNDAKVKFCSQSCSAKVSNSNRAKPKGNCLYCTTLLTNNAITYCNAACQKGYERDLATQLWLTTGKATVAANPRHYVKLYIMNDQNNCCAICSMPPVWNEQEIRFILDHVDGDSNNNTRENLRLVCPNCDSQLPTYKSKNRGNGRHTRRERYAAGKSY